VILRNSVTALWRGIVTKRPLSSGSILSKTNNQNEQEIKILKMCEIRNTRKYEIREIKYAKHKVNTRKKYDKPENTVSFSTTFLMRVLSSSTKESNSSSLHALKSCCATKSCSLSNALSYGVLWIFSARDLIQN
jgi:hypothetical protein